MQTIRIYFSVRVRRILPAANGLGFKYLSPIHSDCHRSWVASTARFDLAQNHARTRRSPGIFERFRQNRPGPEPGHAVLPFVVKGQEAQHAHESPERRNEFHCPAIDGVAEEVSEPAGDLERERPFALDAAAPGPRTFLFDLK